MFCGNFPVKIDVFHATSLAGKKPRILLENNRKWLAI